MSSVRRGASRAAASTASPAVVSARATAGVVLVMMALSISGCRSPEPAPTASPSVTASPVFASEEEALAAATEAYTRYLEVSDAITNEGGSNAARIVPFVTTEFSQVEINGFETFNSKGLRTSGASSFDSIEIQQMPSNPAPGESLVVYLCSEISTLRVLDQTGADVTPPDRPNRLPLQIGFELDADGKLLIASSEVWAGTNFC